MRQHQLSIIAQSRPELVERILRVIRHRGFVVNQMNLQHEPAEVRIELTVSSSRGIELLSTQLTKLIDVVSVHNASTLTSQQTQSIRA